MISAIFTFIGSGEVIMILVIAVLVFGPKKIPEIARGLGQGLRAMRQATDQIKKEVMDGVDKVDPSAEIRKTQQEIEAEVQAAKKEIEEAVGPIKRTKR